MTNHLYEHSTDDIVKETGEYTCEAGITKTLYKGDKFPSCPESEISTYWKHSESHYHNSGDKVTESGKYVDEDGDELELEAGATFPNCPKAGTPTKWKHAGNL
ncbi:MULTISPECIES: hypothetical protein [Bacillaceae]|uniref:hypothetical protein n=1 Tax=Bacillaceae TaxID=186817 RepID=UPI0006AEE272|nr:MULTISPECIES: hypothetical protein [Bacillaceae]ALC86671.1 hypothetical protein AM499_13145 [Bacillus sp. FJAT-22090]KQL37088.1 hypothetical protein AN959_03315 [Psychrobacillus sp. FJAT-21963]